ncbi:MAG: hypothetical protein HOO67_00090 [Candidatus Peribacteraceae bacterium]|nr:hypothetical protein [Candidatus Peribacteraceae bacterium]
MPNRIPDIPGEAGRAGKAVWNVMSQTSGRGVVDTGVNKLTHGLVETAKQSLLVLPYNVFLRPISGTIGDLVRATGRETLTWAGIALRNIPWIPMPGRLGTGNGPFGGRSATVAFPHESIEPPPSFHGPSDLRIGPGPDSPRPDAEPGSPGRAA